MVRVITTSTAWWSQRQLPPSKYHTLPSLLQDDFIPYLLTSLLGYWNRCSDWTLQKPGGWSSSCTTWPTSQVTLPSASSTYLPHPPAHCCQSQHTDMAQLQCLREAFSNLPVVWFRSLSDSRFLLHGLFTFFLVPIKDLKWTTKIHTLLQKFFKFRSRCKIIIKMRLMGSKGKSCEINKGKPQWSGSGG